MANLWEGEIQFIVLSIIAMVRAVASIAIPMVGPKVERIDFDSSYRIPPRRDHPNMISYCLHRWQCRMKNKQRKKRHCWDCCICLRNCLMNVHCRNRIDRRIWQRCRVVVVLVAMTATTTMVQPKEMVRRHQRREEAKRTILHHPKMLQNPLLLQRTLNYQPIYHRSISKKTIEPATMMHPKPHLNHSSLAHKSTRHDDNIKKRSKHEYANTRPYAMPINPWKCL
mmetsp:Transcript_40397/g.84845  ORF Transcript_40397/g.84845 Transcript_40397/m.84845 type:complete len:225 (+) Transcript_40397:220-894(+)